MKQRLVCIALTIALMGSSALAQSNKKHEKKAAQQPESVQANVPVKEEAPAAQGDEQPREDPRDRILPGRGVSKAGKQVKQDNGPVDPEHLWIELKKDWQGFGNWPLLVSVLVSLVLSVVLALPIAYHPRSWGKASTLEEAEQPKIFMMYGLVGAVVAQIVKAYPDMSLVVFGIGGLLRFRTDAGPARDTGRVILVTCVGICCGLGIFLVAIVAVTFGWLLIYWLERNAAHRLTIKGLEPPVLAPAADAYREVLVGNGIVVMSEKKNFVKKQVSFVFRAPEKLGLDDVEGLFKDIPPKLQGAVDWESS